MACRRWVISILAVTEVYKPFFEFFEALRQRSTALTGVEPILTDQGPKRLLFVDGGSILVAMLQVLRRIRRTVVRSLLPVLALTWLSAVVGPCLAHAPSPGESGAGHRMDKHCCCGEASSQSEADCAHCACPAMQSADSGIPIGLSTSFGDPQDPPLAVGLEQPWPASSPGSAPERTGHAGTPSTHPAVRFQRLLI